MSAKRNAYRALALSNDINAIRRGRIGQRLLRRLFGKLTGRTAARLFG